MIIGSKFHYFEEIDSTNEYAKKIAATEPEGTIVFAEKQTRGKGRMDREWYSPEGGIYLSVILHPKRKELIPIIGGVAVCEGFNNYGILLGIKWPNDIMLNNKKVAGILTEVVDNVVILGIGINLNIKEFPLNLKETASSIFIETKKLFDKMMIYRTLCQELDASYYLLKTDKISTILQKWRNYTIIFGRTVRIEALNKTIIGRAIDIASDGSLILVLQDGRIERVVAGDCQVIKL